MHGGVLSNSNNYDPLYDFSGKKLFLGSGDTWAKFVKRTTSIQHVFWEFTWMKDDAYPILIFVSIAEKEELLESTKFNFSGIPISFSSYTVGTDGYMNIIPPLSADKTLESGSNFLVQSNFNPPNNYLFKCYYLCAEK